MSQDSERRPRRAIAHTLEEARAIAKRLWFPIAIKPSFTLAGAGSSVAASQGEFERKFLDALVLSPTGEVLLEKPEGASPTPSDPEFEKWLAGQGTYQKLDPYTLALNAWCEARCVQMKKDCAVVGNHLEHCRIYQSDDNEGDCVCEAERHMNAIRVAFEKEHPE